MENKAGKELGGRGKVVFTVKAGHEGGHEGGQEGGRAGRRAGGRAGRRAGKGEGRKREGLGGEGVTLCCRFSIIFPSHDTSSQEFICSEDKMKFDKLRRNNEV
eukprot:17676-Hanusia_phi.AAC.2